MVIYTQGEKNIFTQCKFFDLLTVSYIQAKKIYLILLLTGLKISANNCEHFKKQKFLGE
tara:strand:- start:484 stop:660 length:177 start_codon:yes stop_codon:yes gene_type:complete